MSSTIIQYNNNNDIVKVFHIIIHELRINNLALIHCNWVQSPETENSFGVASQNTFSVQQGFLFSEKCYKTQPQETEVQKIFM